MLLTLVDNETPLWLDAAAAAARDWLAFHCGAAIVAATERGRVRVALSLPDLAALPAGTHEAPETSATLILQVAALGARHALSPVGAGTARTGAAGGRRAAGGLRRGLAARTMRCFRAASTSSCAPAPRWPRCRAA